MSFLGLLTTLLIFLVSEAEGLATGRRWCFYTNWAQYRKGTAKFVPKDIDVTLCTHVSYAFAKIKSNKVTAFEWNDEDTKWSKGMYRRVNDLKSSSPGLRTLLAIGGWNMGSNEFSSMVSSKSTRAVFITSLIEFLRQRNFDGVDLAWEYPGARGSPASDKQRYSELLQELRKSFDYEAARTGKEVLILGLVVAADDNLIIDGYDASAVAKCADSVSLLSYDFYTTSGKLAVHSSALFAGNVTKGIDGKRNVVWVANFWVSQGVPKHKINIGIAFYAHNYLLARPSDISEGSQSLGPGLEGPYTKTRGFLAYYEVCTMRNTQKHFMLNRGVPFLISGNEWISYEDEQSVGLKADWAVKNGFGGVMAWSLDTDDFYGLCGGKYPLLKRIRDTMEGIHINTTEGPTIPPSWIYTFCKSRPQGMYQKPNTCIYYVICTGTTGIEGSCQNGQMWNPKINRCDDASNVQCTMKTTTTVPTTTSFSISWFCKSKSDGMYKMPHSCTEYIICTGKTGLSGKCVSGQLWDGKTNRCQDKNHVHCVP